MKSLSILLVTVAIAGCVHTRSSLPIQPGVCTPTIEACETREDEDLCHAAITCYTLMGKGMKCEARLKAAEELCAIDAAEREAEVYSLKQQRWIWGIVGLAAGALVTGLTVGLSR